MSDVVAFGWPRLFPFLSFQLRPLITIDSVVPNFYTDTMFEPTAPTVMEQWLAFHIEVRERVASAERSMEPVEAEVSPHGSSTFPLLVTAAVGERALTFLRRLALQAPGVWADADITRLRGLDPDGLSRDELVEFVGVLNRAKALVDAKQVKVLAALDRRDVSGFQTVREEVACVLAISPPAAAKRLAQARAVDDHLPVAYAALAAGDVSLEHLAGLARMAGRVGPAIAAAVDAQVSADCHAMTPPMIDRAVLRAVASADPGGIGERHERAVADRYVTVYPAPDGMATLSVYGPAHDVQAVYTRIDAASRLLPRDDVRTLPQRRFDLLVDGLLSGIPADGLPTAQGRAPQIQVIVAATTLLGRDDQPAELVGYGPIDAHTTRRLAADPTGTWRRIVTDPVTGQIIDYGRSTYRPPQNLVDHVTARDRTCRFPGCSVPAYRCDLDHIMAWERGGETKAANLAALCRRHHRLKTENYWTYELHDRRADWTSPTGRHYITAPETIHPPPAESISPSTLVENEKEDPPPF